MLANNESRQIQPAHMVWNTLWQLKFTCRWRLPLRRRAWNDPGVSMVCCRERTECEPLTELCLNHGNDIFLRLLLCFVCMLPAGAFVCGGGVVDILMFILVCTRVQGGAGGRGAEDAGAGRLASSRSCGPTRGVVATAARFFERLSCTLACYTTQPPYRATFPKSYYLKPPW